MRHRSNPPGFREGYLVQGGPKGFLSGSHSLAVISIVCYLFSILVINDHQSSIPCLILLLPTCQNTFCS